MSFRLQICFSLEEMNELSPDWDGSLKWRSSDGRCEFEIYANTSGITLSSAIEGVPRRIIFVDIMYFVEMMTNNEACWHMCCPYSKDDNTLVSVGKYTTLKEILAAL